MTQAKSGVRRAWVGFSALAFAICGVLLLIQFSGQMKKPTSAAPPPAPTPGAPSMPASETSISKPADPPQIAAKEDHPERGPARDEPTKPPTAAAVTNPVATNPPSSRRPEGHGASGKLGRTGAGKGAPAGYGAGAGALRDPVKLERVVPTAGKKLPAPPAKIRAPAQRVAPDAEPEVQPEEPAKVVRPSTSSPVEEKLSEGALKVNVPPSMTLGQSEHVRAVIGTKKNSALVDKEAALEANDGARVQIGRDLMISPLVRMELRSDNVGEFDINPLAPDATQRINDNDVTIWEWSVTPKLEGLHGLTLIVSDLKDGSRDAIRTKIYPVHIEVRVTAWQRVREVAVAGSSVLSGLAGLIGAWLGLLRPLLQRRQGGGDRDPGSISPRSPQVFSPPLAAAPPVAVAPAPQPHTPPPAAIAAAAAVAATPLVSTIPAAGALATVVPTAAVDPPASPPLAAAAPADLSTAPAATPPTGQGQPASSTEKPAAT